MKTKIFFSSAKDATHMDLYDGKQYVPQVAKKLAEFFFKNL